jgi:GDP-4-dehydro-6-deoxy-D-mannose reductase
LSDGLCHELSPNPRDNERDWTDVRDVVRAYWLALEHSVPGEVYNISSGIRPSVGQMLELLLTMTDV